MRMAKRFDEYHRLWAVTLGKKAKDSTLNDKTILSLNFACRQSVIEEIPKITITQNTQIYSFAYADAESKDRSPLK